MVKKILNALAAVLILAALFTASTASSFLFYQPKTPKCLLR